MSGLKMDNKLPYASISNLLLVDKGGERVSYECPFRGDLSTYDARDALRSKNNQRTAKKFGVRTPYLQPAFRCSTIKILLWEKGPTVD